MKISPDCCCWLEFTILLHLFLGSENHSQIGKPLVYLDRGTNRQKYLEAQIMKSKSLLGREKSKGKMVYKVAS